MKRVLLILLIIALAYAVSQSNFTNGFESKMSPDIKVCSRADFIDVLIVGSTLMIFLDIDKAPIVVKVNYSDDILEGISAGKDIYFCKVGSQHVIELRTRDYTPEMSGVITT